MIHFARSLPILLVPLVRVVRTDGLSGPHLEVVVMHSESRSSVVGPDEAGGPEEEVEGEGELWERGKGQFGLR